MAGGEIDEVLPQEIELDAFHDDGEVSLAVFGDDDTYGIATALVEIQGEVAGAVVELAGGFADAQAGFRGEVFGQWGIVEDKGDRRLGDAQIGGEILEAGALSRQTGRTGRSWRLGSHRLPRDRSCGGFRSILDGLSGSNEYTRCASPELR